MRNRLTTTILTLIAAAMAHSARADSDEEFFENRIRPLLVAQCISCHGPKKQESNLRLDSFAALRKGGDGGEVLVPGHPEKSRLIEAIRGTGDLKMPPQARLRDDQIDLLARWVERGAPWPADASRDASSEPWRDHWAYQEIRRPPLPQVEHPDWARTAVDLFLLEELEGRGVTAQPRADRRTLIRRAMFDLLGLPPSPDEVVAFENDPAADAYERLVDRLLASPAYGERWGRHWLDVARYADTKGYVFFEDKLYPWAYTYRDYVIRALNSDLAYDRFVMEQLAADQLEGGTDRSSWAALGFLTVGSHFMNNTHDIVDDRIDVVTRGLMGMTLTCARCHDHKYDPLTMKDYYGLYGVFRSSYEPMVPPVIAARTESDEYRKFAAEMDDREKKLRDFVTGKHSELVEGARKRAGEYLLAAFQLRDRPPTDDFMLLVDKGDLNPTMILRWQVYLAERRGQPDPVWSAWHALADLPAESFSQQAMATIQSQVRSGGTAEGMNPLVREALLRSPLNSMADVARRYGELLGEIDSQWQSHVRTAAEAGQPAPGALEDSHAEQLRSAIYAAGSPPDVPLAMDWGFLSLFPDRPTQEEYQKLLKAVEQWMTSQAASIPRAMVLLDEPRPHEPRIFLRGNPNRTADVVPRRFPAVVDRRGQPFQHGSGRKELAQAIVDPANPLTSRVIVNRIWLHHFGRGLVETTSDFGLRSEPPSHPKLLDWLASQLIDNDWSLKWLHREIMLSAAYQAKPASPQASGAGAERPEAPSAAHLQRRRLDFESMRDAMLVAADCLDRRQGGPPVELLTDTIVPRRTIYGRLDRMDVPPLLTTFDFPDPLTTSPQRTATTVAPQALYVMNSAFVAEVARRMLLRPEIEYGTSRSQRIEKLYWLCLGRAPAAEEMELAQRFLGDLPDEAQWVRFGQALLMTNEFLFID